MSQPLLTPFSARTLQNLAMTLTGRVQVSETSDFLPRLSFAVRRRYLDAPVRFESVRGVDGLSLEDLWSVDWSNPLYLEETKGMGAFICSTKQIFHAPCSRQTIINKLADCQ